MSSALLLDLGLARTVNSSLLPKSVGRSSMRDMTSQQLSQNATEKFKAIYLKEFGQNISDAEAKEMGIRLLNLLKLILEPNGSSDRPH
jgi:hypothetical protein